MLFLLTSLGDKKKEDHLLEGVIVMHCIILVVNTCLLNYFRCKLIIIYYAVLSKQAMRRMKSINP